MGNASNSPGSSTSPRSDYGFKVFVGSVVVALGYRAAYAFIFRFNGFWANHPLLARLGIGLIAVTFLALLFALGWNCFSRKKAQGPPVTEDDGESVYLGKDVKTGEKVYLRPAFRTMHTQLIGTTNAGKTASVILPWAADDIARGRGLLVVDGKSDLALLEQLYTHAVRAEREDDFLVFSLADPSISSTFNPFCHGSPEQITERVFSSFEFTDEYYRSIQFAALRTVIAMLRDQRQAPLPGVIRELLRDREKLKAWTEKIRDENLVQDVLKLTQDDDEEYAKKYSGLVTALGHFSQGKTAPLYNTQTPDIVLGDILKKKKICYFQLPTMQYPFLGSATGKLLLQTLQSAISELQVGGEKNGSLFSVYLDDFNDYIYPGFGSLLNKSRSANVGVVFSHQSLGDLEKVSPEFKQIVLTNTNIKIVMRSNDPDSAEHFAKTIGTTTGEKSTERRKRVFFGQENTGDQSVREVEEYIHHPNVIKSELGLGEGIVLIPHPRGRVVKRIRFQAIPELFGVPLPVRNHAAVNFVAAVNRRPADAPASTRSFSEALKDKKVDASNDAATEKQEGKRNE